MLNWINEIHFQSISRRLMYLCPLFGVLPSFDDFSKRDNWSQSENSNRQTQVLDEIHENWHATMDWINPNFNMHRYLFTQAT